MNEALFSFCANIFGFVAGGISLLGFIVAVCRPHLPSNKIKTLVDLLHETEDMFKEAVEDELLVPEFIERTGENLAGLKERTHVLRARVYNVTTLGRDYAQLLGGTSGAIGLVCQSVKKLRAEIITSSQERRHRLGQIGSVLTHLPPSPSDPMTQPNPSLRPPVFITRPRSCPPTAELRRCAECTRWVVG